MTKLEGQMSNAVWKMAEPFWPLAFVIRHS